MAEQHIPPQERQNLLTDVRTGFLAWRTRDILIIAVVGLVFGLLLIGASYAPIFTVVFGPVFQWLWNGLWVIAPIFIAYVLRRPGASFLTSVLCELVMLIFVPSGFLGLIRGGMYGLCIELVVALVTPLIIVGIFCVLAISCAICSVVAKLLADAVARTGALSGTALGRISTVEV
jgi:ABC-type thiamin/hydroxymethylpyrimidine transport system permease subunit